MPPQERLKSLQQSSMNYLHNSIAINLYNHWALRPSSMIPLDKNEQEIQSRK